jgi:hypothetical protein
VLRLSEYLSQFVAFGSGIDTQRARIMARRKTNQPAHVVTLRDRLTITLSTEVTRLIGAEVRRQVEREAEFERLSNESANKRDLELRELGIEPMPREPYAKRPPQTPEQIVEEAIRALYG